MAGEASNPFNFDLNLGPADQPGDDTGQGWGSIPEGAINLEDFLSVYAQTNLEAVRQTRLRTRQTQREFPVPEASRSNPVGNGWEHGESSVAAAEKCPVLDENDPSGKNQDGENHTHEEDCFFECNICLDLAKEPVVTCCGHLFCWHCIYKWLQVHSDVKECPVCKGAVTIRNVTPIYGRGNITAEPEEDSGLKIPVRPLARRVESWRETIQRISFPTPLEDIIQQLGNRFQWTTAAPQGVEGGSSLLNLIMTSRGRRGEQNIVTPPGGAVGIGQGSPGNSGALVSQSPLNSPRPASVTNLGTETRSGDSYLHPVEGNHELLLPFDDRDSVSSIAAVVGSPVQTIDSTNEIVSRTLRSGSSSRRRHGRSRIPVADGGNSRAPRRRRRQR